MFNRHLKTKDFIILYYRDVASESLETAEEHLKACPACRKKFEDLKIFLSRIKEPRILMEDFQKEIFIQNLKEKLSSVKERRISIPLKILVPALSAIVILFLWWGYAKLSFKSALAPPDIFLSSLIEDPDIILADLEILEEFSP